MRDTFRLSLSPGVLVAARHLSYTMADADHTRASHVRFIGGFVVQLALAYMATVTLYAKRKDSKKTVEEPSVQPRGRHRTGTFFAKT